LADRTTKRLRDKIAHYRYSSAVGYLGCFASLVAGLCWLYRVSAQELELRVARFQLRLFAAGIVAIAALSILVYLTHQSIPFWRNERNFGPFLNRNQTADLFGFTSVLILASGQDDIRHGRTRWVFWVIALAIVIAAICLNFSRAGILILLASSAIWIATVALRLGAPARACTACRISLAVSFLLILVSVLCLPADRSWSVFICKNSRAAISGRFRMVDFPGRLAVDSLLTVGRPWAG
jgi:hypothetical protein